MKALLKLFSVFVLAHLARSQTPVRLAAETGNDPKAIRRAPPAPAQATPLAAGAQDTRAAAPATPVWQDPNGDGKADLLLQDGNGQLAIWFMKGVELAGGLPVRSSQPGDPGIADARLVAATDLEGDGKPDWVFQRADGSLAVSSLDGASLAASAPLEPNHPGDRRWRVVGSGDFNADGKQDLLFQHAAHGRLAVWLMDGKRRVSHQSPSTARPEPADAWKVAGVADMDRDGQPDLVFQNLNGQVAVWFMDGLNLRHAAYLTPDNPGTNWRVAGVADRNEDGQPDLLLQRASDRALAVAYLDGWHFRSTQMFSPVTAAPDTYQIVGP